ncbi:hypothetical protein B0A49_02580 [Cryomyces minteri]|uniref:Glycoside hydrolase family 43 protein n=1 Tax=Cryomyces minteri TaxID=331657 RepID=A0A4U0XLS9_9PEZI|nr:hypothetical protein B0A49_02580 [Cryomyces minteri]
MLGFIITAASLSSLSLLFSHASAIPVKRAVSGPVVIADFPDPSIIKIQDTWYAFATQPNFNGNIHIQIASSKDFSAWTVMSGADALPNMPSWVNTTSGNGLTWAPDVTQRDDGSFVMYYSAVTNTAGEGRLHCVGAATASSVTGPYAAVGNGPFVCPTDQGGAIDASGFRDQDRTRYVVYKVDGNAIGHGGSCNNGVAPIVPTPIMLQQVAEDGITKVGGPTQLLTNDASDGPVVEAPSMMRSPDGTYYLFFSSNCYATPDYDVAYATAFAPTGPFTKYGPLLKTGTYNLNGPGGADVDQDGKHMLFHANYGSGRAMYTAEIAVSGNLVTA